MIKSNSAAKPAKREHEGLKPEQSFLSIKPANEWLEEASKTPVPKMLCGELWFEGEICILYADTNKGKSILATQIGDANTKGVDIGPLKVEVGGSKVLYLDFEHTKKQFETRYAVREGDYFTDHYRFSSNFLRAEINPECLPDISDSEMDEFIYEQIEKAIDETGAKIIILDNLTLLESDPEKSKKALTLMRKLKMLKEKYQFSLLVLSHTPKRDQLQAINENHLLGSKMLMNLADSSFAIAKCSESSNSVYIKQIKQRNVDPVYHQDNVLVCDIRKDHNFLRFDTRETARERDLLGFSENVATREKKVEIVRQLHDEGLSQREIAEKAGISLGSVNIYLKEINHD